MKTQADSLLTARREANSRQDKVRYCLTCEKEIKSKNPNKKFCRDRCRLLHWTVNILIKEYKAGQVNGLRDLIKELCE